MSWVRDVAERLYQGMPAPARWIVGGLARWIRAGDSRGNRALRIACVAALILVPLLVALRPRGFAAVLSTIGLTCTVAAAAILAPLLGLTMFASLVASSAPWLMWLAVPAWLGAAWWAERPRKAAEEAPKEQQVAEEETEGEPEETPAPTPQDPRAEFVEAILEAIGDARGIHLRDLYPKLRARPGWGALTDDQIRAGIDRYGIPTVRSMSVAGKDGRTGIRKAALQALLNETAQAVPYPTESAPSRNPESGSDLRESRAPRAAETANLGPSRRSESGLDAHADDALSLANTARSSAA